MAARLAPLVLVLVLGSGCKSMGGFASGLGHVAGGMAKVASSVGKVAGGVAGGVGHAMSGAGRVVGGVGRITGGTLARATPEIAKASAAVLRTAVPIVEAVGEAAVTTTPDPDPIEFDPDAHVSMSGPLIDDHDPCNQCPDDLACEQCLGFGDAACRLTPPGAFARCESSAAR